MTAALTPAMVEFLARLGDELVLAQIRIRRTGRSFELRHADDASATAGDLRLVPLVPLAGLRQLAQFNAAGGFRPLKAAPNLQTGWRATVSDAAALEAALNTLYPGAVADWFAALTTSVPVTHYREFTARQTGMYRITAHATAGQAGLIVRACCPRRFCLKQRRWTVDGLAPDGAGEKSLIPCLEPCAVLLEFARKAMRLEQEDNAPPPLAREEVAMRRATLAASLEHLDVSEREADFNSPANPRRVQLLLEKLAPTDPAAPQETDASEASAK